MEFRHFLVKKAYLFEDRDTKDPEDCVFDDVKGLWVWDKDNKVLVKSNHPKCSNLTSKKLDVEKS